MKTLLLSLVVACFATSASAAPLSNQTNSMMRPSIAENVRIVCHADGYCYRLPGRPKVARWIYGDHAFYGPYVGPGYYGRPGSHSGWWW